MVFVIVEIDHFLMYDIKPTGLGKINRVVFIFTSLAYRNDLGVRFALAS